MIPVRQRGNSAEDGLTAAAASILEVSLDDLPPTLSDSEGEDQKWCEYLESRGLYEIKMPVDLTWSDVPPGYSILCCRSTARNEPHCVVCLCGCPIWDPNADTGAIDWVAIIRDRSWEVLRPIKWVAFATTDPSKWKTTDRNRNE